ncbi:MAG: hypothetical protein Q8L41_12525 [Anaerolineales bacterium]|nr:hypothetical protein [Anaerolineales bacterium]
MFPYLYAHEKLSTSVRILAIGEGDIRSRLQGAFNEFHTLQSKDIPPELQKDYAWIIKELTKREPKYQFDTIDNPFDENQMNYLEWKKDGSLLYNLRRMKNRTGSRIAKKVCDLQDSIQLAYEEYRLELRKS